MVPIFEKHVPYITSQFKQSNRGIELIFLNEALLYLKVQCNWMVTIEVCGVDGDVGSNRLR